MKCACAVLSSVARPSLEYFSTLSHKRHDFRKRLLNIKCILIFSTVFLCGKSVILGITEQDMVKNVYWSLCRF